jgi:hypothetical protein
MRKPPGTTFCKYKSEAFINKKNTVIKKLQNRDEVCIILGNPFKSQYEAAHEKNAISPTTFLSR